MHRFSCTHNVACVHVTFKVVTVHAICEGLHKNFLFCSRTGECMYKKNNRWAKIARTTILMWAFCNTHSNSHMEETIANFVIPNSWQLYQKGTFPMHFFSGNFQSNFSYEKMFWEGSERLKNKANFFIWE